MNEGAKPGVQQSVEDANRMHTHVDGLRGEVRAGLDEASALGDEALWDFGGRPNHEIVRSLSEDDLYDLIDDFVTDQCGESFTLEELRREVPLYGIDTRWVLDCIRDVAAATLVSSKPIEAVAKPVPDVILAEVTPEVVVSTPPGIEPELITQPEPPEVVGADNEALVISEPVVDPKPADLATEEAAKAAVVTPKASPPARTAPVSAWLTKPQHIAPKAERPDRPVDASKVDMAIGMFMRQAGGQIGGKMLKEALETSFNITRKQVERILQDQCEEGELEQTSAGGIVFYKRPKSDDDTTESSQEIVQAS